MNDADQPDRDLPAVDVLDDAPPTAFDAALAALANPSPTAAPEAGADDATVADDSPEVEAPEVEAAEVDEVDVDLTDDVATDAAMDDAANDDADGELLADAEVVEIIETAPKIESPFDRPGAWYIVHTYAGYENKVKQNLASRVKSMTVEDKIFEVVIPMEEVIEFKGGKKHVVSKKLFPGYLYIRMELDDESWYVVRNTPGVTGFVGGGAKPVPLTRKSVEDVLGVPKLDEEGGFTTEKKARPRLEFEVGEQVRVVTGPFADFNGVINEIDVDRSRFKVLVNIFGRETPVELEFGDVAKL
jgi:transcriptional antiterminator NusG